jgi:hypothetical protein
MTLEIGQKMDDGTIFVGTPPTDGQPLFRAPQCLHLHWDKANEHLRTTPMHGYPAGAFRLGTEEELSLLQQHWDETGGFGPEQLPARLYGGLLLASSTSTGKVFCISLETGRRVTAERSLTKLIICPVMTR